ncbi:MAG: Folylpolyglutamate synthase [Chroococcopsis gigantea SAG 12.99]|jgi:dihydrofolate synthase/folylpolyglutamate synthase|nr:bifunctional folylpolyglutamate synthase/dihydrofolate synthase [Chlorogloea purpurea SAG 13.99]MDV2999662.1 Folylpolyglutamate synthase [Chroococcopsis gigantea SAG 12.99]
MIDELLKPYQRFGVNLGLDRINHLLAILDNPHLQIPLVHVTGTNGKGSVCAYLSSILSEAGYKVGRYISPHLIDWTERISINNYPISHKELERILQYINSVIDPQKESPTQFEVITAAAWLYFAREGVDIAVMEVGLGGRLDATNVCPQPLVSVITSISLEHWQNLGPTIAHIAGEKAGILKSHCPAVIAQLPPAAKTVIAERIELLDCPAVWVKPARKIEEGWGHYEGIDYPLPLAGDFQLMNSALAIATVQILREKGWQIDDRALQEGMSKTRWSGRLQWVEWHDRSILIDGAHNEAAALGLRDYVDSLGKCPIWVMGMLSTKDHEKIFKALLRGGESLYLAPVPDHNSADSENLASLAPLCCEGLEFIGTYPDVFSALKNAVENNESTHRVIVLCGSLYLVGYFLAHKNKCD